jgi:tricorn protease-like protein
MRLLILAFLLFGSFYTVCGQSGSTEIYLVSLTQKEGKIKCGTPVNITNHEGYDNQPVFSSDSKRIMYVSMPDTLQSDLFEYNLSDSTTKQLTSTAESEFSPRFAPLRNHVTFVRVDADKGQRLYISTSEFSGEDDLIYGLDSIGYYCWLNDSVVALACLNNGMDLFIYELNSGQYVILDRGIGRCLMNIPGTTDLVYTKRTGNKTNLFRYSPGADANSPYCEGLGDTEDYAFTPDGKLLAGQNGKLFMYDPDKGSSWTEIADLNKTAGLFYRLAVSPDGKHLALVTYKGKRP